MNIRDVLRNAGFTLLTFSLVVFMALVAKNGDIIVGKNDKEDTVSPNYSVENVTKTTYENESYGYLPDYYMESTEWGKDYKEVEDMIEPWDKEGEYFTDSFNEIIESASGISIQK